MSRIPSAFASALLGMKPGPCLHCLNFDRCAQEKVACWSFQRYVNLKTVTTADVDRHPNKRIYDTIFKNGDAIDG